MRITLPIVTFGMLVGLAGTAAFAGDPDHPRAFLTAFAKEAQQADPPFQPDAKRGAHFFRHRFGNNERMASCATCHTPDPTKEGKHFVTSKPIAPLAPRVNPKRFTDAKKVHKWFTRNCKEVVGRACTAAEKADLLAFLIEE